MPFQADVLGMADDPAYIIDLSHTAEGEPADAAAQDTKEPRPWIGVQFECCGVYMRIYRNRQGTAYEGNCPRCSRPLRVKVGPGGTSNRLFRAE